MIELLKDIGKLIVYGYAIYVIISLVGMFILMGFMLYAWT